MDIPVGSGIGKKGGASCCSNLCGVAVGKTSGGSSKTCAGVPGFGSLHADSESYCKVLPTANHEPQ